MADFSMSEIPDVGPTKADLLTLRPPMMKKKIGNISMVRHREVKCEWLLPSSRPTALSLSSTCFLPHRPRLPTVCPVGALGFYLYHLFHIKKDPFPDLSDRAKFYNRFVFYGYGHCCFVVLRPAGIASLTAAPLRCLLSIGSELA
jgi:hypothetical protein